MGKTEVLRSRSGKFEKIMSIKKKLLLCGQLEQPSRGEHVFLFVFCLFKSLLIKALYIFQHYIGKSKCSGLIK